MLLVVAALMAAGCGASRPVSPAARASGGAARAGPSAPLVYRVVTDRSAEVLAVTAEVPAGLSVAFGTDEVSAAFIDDVKIDGKTAVFRGGMVRDDVCKRDGCVLTFSCRLAAAARAMREPDYALAARGAFVATPSTFLLRPLEDTAGRYHLVVTGTPFVSSLRPHDDAYEGDLRDLAATGYAGFGDLVVDNLDIGGSVVVVAMDRGVGVERQAGIRDWVRAEAEAVSKMYGHFPVKRAAVFVSTVRGQDVVFGKTLGHGAASVVVMVGQDTRPETLRLDWVLAHELVHLALPALDERHRWFEEGVATYLEPAVRAEAGFGTPEEAWNGLLTGMKNGLPASGDRGLDHTDTWGRRYWGGALFCLTADLALREKTGNKKGLRDALRAIRETYGGINERHDLREILQGADRALAVTVLGPLYDEWAERPVLVDLGRTWAYLGVVKNESAVTLSDAAEGAAVRRAIIGDGGRSPTVADDGTSRPMEKTSSGLQFEDTVKGTGASPTRGQTCQMHYTGWLWVDGAKGQKFDSSHDRGKPFSFKIGVGQVIGGWDEGVATMQVGGKRTLVIPPDLGYGSRGAGSVIGPNATLLFEVELLGIQ